MYYGNDGLVEGGESAVPITFFTLKGLRKRLKPRHGGHFFDAVDEQGRPGAAQKKIQVTPVAVADRNGARH